MFLRKTNADIYLNPQDFAFAEQSTFSLLRAGGSWSVRPESGTIFLNGEKINANTPLKPGDEIFWNFTQMRVTEQDLLEIVHYAQFETALTETVKPSTEMQKNIRSTEERRGWYTICRMTAFLSVFPLRRAIKPTEGCGSSSCLRL